MSAEWEVVEKLSEFMDVGMIERLMSCGLVGHSRYIVRHIETGEEKEVLAAEEHEPGEKISEGDFEERPVVVPRDEHAEPADSEAKEEVEPDMSSSSDSHSSSADYSYSFSPASVTKSAFSKAKGIAFVVLWMLGSSIGMAIAGPLSTQVHPYSAVWCLLGIVMLACAPGFLATVVLVLAVYALYSIVYFILHGLYLLIVYFINHSS